VTWKERLRYPATEATIFAVAAVSGGKY